MTRQAPPMATPSTPRVLATLAARSGYRTLFGALALVITVGYTLLLTVDKTKQLAWSNWAHLTPMLGFFSIALGASMAAVLTLQVAAVRQMAAARRTGTSGTLGGLGLVASLAPSVCCTPLLPTVLAAVGMSTAGAASAAAVAQPLFATYKTAFLVGSLALLILTGWFSAHRIATAVGSGKDTA